MAAQLVAFVDRFRACLVRTELVEWLYQVYPRFESVEQTLGEGTQRVERSIRQHECRGSSR
jgi:hypothetical protein